MVTRRRGDHLLELHVHLKEDEVEDEEDEDEEDEEEYMHLHHARGAVLQSGVQQFSSLRVVDEIGERVEGRRKL